MGFAHEDHYKHERCPRAGASQSGAFLFILVTFYNFIYCTIKFSP